MPNPQQAIPNTQQQFVTSDGLITPPWYRLLLNLWNRTGGSVGDTSGLPTTINAPTGTLLNATAMNAAVVLRSGPTANFSDIIDNASNYVSAHNFPVAPSTNIVVFINLTAFAWTITPTSSVTFQGNLVGGNFVIAANAQRVLTFEIDNVSTPAIKIIG